MRILTVCTSTKVFGAEVITLNMLEGFRKAGHEQLAVTSIWTDGEFNRRLQEIGVEERRLPFGAFSKLLRLQPMWWTANTLIRLPWLWSGWRRTLLKFRPDIVLFTSPRLALPVARLTDHLPCFLIEHSNQGVTGTRQRMYRILREKLTGFVAVSNFTGRHLRQFGIPEDKIHVIRNGLHPRAPKDLTGATRKVQKRYNDRLRIGIIGQVHPAKGHDLLVEACRLLRNRQIDVAVNVYGTGEESYINSLKGKLEELGLHGSWEWMGYERDQSRIYGSIDICVMPSASEAFGMVAAEASSREIPVIATRVGALPEVIQDGVTGFLIPPGDARELAEKISFFAEQPETLKRFGGEGRKKMMLEFTQERMIDEYDRLFRTTLARRAKGDT